MPKKMKRYRLKFDRVLASATVVRKGTVVFEFRGYDYGCAQQDSIETGSEHIAVTINERGEGPFFTVASDDLELVED